MSNSSTRVSAVLAGLLGISTVLFVPVDAFIGGQSFFRHNPSSRLVLSSTATNLVTATEKDVISTAREFITNNSGYFSRLDETMLADDFIFRGPVIGPLNKEDYAEVLDYFKVYEAFPDIDPNCFGFTVDPEDPLRVWFFMRCTGTYRAPLGGFLGKAADAVAPRDVKYRGSPEAWSITLDNDLKVRRITAGYVADRFDNDATTDGRGLTFGILNTMGLSLASGTGDPRLQFTQWFTGLFADGGLFPKAASAPDKVPKWWTNDKRGADP